VAEFPYCSQEKIVNGRLLFVDFCIVVGFIPLSLKAIQQFVLAVTEKELLVLLTKAGTFCTPTEPPKSLVFLENPETEKLTSPGGELLELAGELALLELAGELALLELAGELALLELGTETHLHVPQSKYWVYPGSGKSPQSLSAVPFTGSQSRYIEQFTEELLGWLVELLGWLVELLGWLVELLGAEDPEELSGSQLPPQSPSYGPPTISWIAGFTSSSGMQNGSFDPPPGLLDPLDPPPGLLDPLDPPPGLLDPLDPPPGTLDPSIEPIVGYKSWLDCGLP